MKRTRFYGTTTVGEKGQVVLPADLRRDLNIQPGDKLAVLVLQREEIQGVVIVSSDVLTAIVDRFLGGALENH